MPARWSSGWVSTFFKAGASRKASAGARFEESGLRERKEQMGILEAAKPAIVICTRDRARATAF
jgi:hypothetical protein